MLKSLVILLVVGGALALALIWGAWRWDAKTRELRAQLAATRKPLAITRVDLADLGDLPAPVSRYFRKVLTDGQPLIQRAALQHTGTFNTSETDERWKSFSSDQVVFTHGPAFDWEGRIALGLGTQIRVHDAYLAGEGVLHASLFGLVDLVDMRGGGDLATGELMRFFAEAAWYPTALLPSQGTRWEGIDERSARATWQVDGVSVSLDFTFDEDGLIDTVYSSARSRTVAGRSIATPWQGRFWNYEVRHGVRIPIDGEVSWLLPEGPKPYWRGHLIELSFETAEAATPETSFAPTGAAKPEPTWR